MEKEKANQQNKKTLSIEELKACLNTLQGLVENSDHLLLLKKEERVALMQAAGMFSRPNRDELKKRRKNLNKEKKNIVRQMDRKARGTTGIRSARTANVFEAPEQLLLPETKINMEDQELHSPRNCYVCKAEFTKLHPFYDTMCESCGDLNYAKRFQTADLTGQVALMTGSRLKLDTTLL